MNTLGIDIDGVLNDHRPHFCRVLAAKAGKTLSSEAITAIPVRKIPGTSVTEADEHAVFNWASYWTDMPPTNEPVGELIDQLRKQLNARVVIFTSRGWPVARTIPKGREGVYWRDWSRVSSWGVFGRLQHLPVIGSSMEELGLSDWLGNHLMSAATTSWLQQHQIRYDRLVIERHALAKGPARAGVEDRFTYASARRFRAFVEDNLGNARRLSPDCEWVFLINHPYNQCPGSSLPSNIVRVTSWREIVDALLQCNSQSEVD